MRNINASLCERSEHDIMFFTNSDNCYYLKCKVKKNEAKHNFKLGNGVNILNNESKINFTFFPPFEKDSQLNYFINQFLHDLKSTNFIQNEIGLFKSKKNQFYI